MSASKAIAITEDVETWFTAMVEPQPLGPSMMICACVLVTCCILAGRSADVDGTPRSRAFARDFESMRSRVAERIANASLEGSSVIPKTVFISWKTERLPPVVLPIHQRWLALEPGYTRRIISDAECRALAAHYPNMLEPYDAMLQNVNRADTCRLLAIYFYGGIYMDLDLLPVRPLDEWLNRSAGFVFGNETSSGDWKCQWFFAAERGHPCLKAAIDLIVERGRGDKPLRTMLRNLDWVHELSGPQVYSDGIHKCGAVATLTKADVKTDKILHISGSRNWRNVKTYSAWGRVGDDIYRCLFAARPHPRGCV